MRVLAVVGVVAFIVYLIWKYGSTANSSDDSQSSFDPGSVDLVNSSEGVTAVSNSDVNASSGQGLFATWADAIFHHEGGKPGDRNVRNNNPGNLKYAGQAGATGKDAQGFAIFPDMATGFAALDRQLQKFVREFPGYSLLQIMTRYLGGNPFDPKVTNQGDPFAYANAVASKLGTSSSDTLSNIFGA